MSKARELTEIEKFYIEHNLGKTDSQIASKISGVGVKTVAKYREEVESSTESSSHVKEETQEERVERIKKGPSSGEFIARRDGVAIMTQQASEFADVRKSSPTKKEEEERLLGKIHRPKN